MVAVITAGLACWILRTRSWVLVASLATTAGVATFVWRLAANTTDLNKDGFPGFSANDLLAPALTYIALGIYASVCPPHDRVRFARLRVAVTAAALLVNVVTI